MSYSAKELFKKIIIGDATKGKKLKLVGDSITHGVGGSGFAQSGEVIVEGWKRNPDGFCWAKLFSEILYERFGCHVVNNACTGTNIEFVIKNFTTLVDTDDDLVICTIGTNNRHQNKSDGEKKTREEMFSSFLENVKKLANMFCETSVPVIFVANIPAVNESDGETYWRILHMDDIREAYVSASEELGLTLIDMYTLMNDYCSRSGRELDTLLSDGLHPNDEGYRVMLDLILGALGVQ